MFTKLPRSFRSVLPPVEAGDAPLLAVIVRLTVIALLVTLALSWPLYIQSERIFAPAPLFTVLAGTPAWLDWLLLGAESVALLLLLVNPQQRDAAMVACSILLFWMMQDLLRLQPYTYLYGFTLLFAALHQHDKRDGVRALRVMVIGTYFWAGFHKLNASFVFDVYPWFIAPFYQFGEVPTWLDRVMLSLGIATPFFEMMIGLLLLFRRTRRVATGMALIMLLVVLVCLGPLGHNINVIVWPWNLALFATEFLLFARSGPAPIKIRRRGDALWWTAYLLFIIAPGLSLFNLWPAYPSFRLYSGNVATAAVSLAADEPLAQLPPKLAPLMGEDRVLPLSTWTNAEFSTVTYPDPYVFITGAAGLCPYLRYPQDARIRIALPPPFYETTPKKLVLPLCVGTKRT